MSFSSIDQAENQTPEREDENHEISFICGSCSGLKMEWNPNESES